LIKTGGCEDVYLYFHIGKKL